MEAEKKLYGAAYHLQRMEELYLKNDEHFIYELEAFLVKVRSILDVLLEDFNKKFCLGISSEERLSPDLFEERALRSTNKEAIEFIKWWRHKKDSIRSSKLGSLLFEKRNLSVHRKVISPDLKKVTVYDNIHIEESVTIRKYDAEGNLIEEFDSQDTPVETVASKSAEMDWFFSEYPNENVLKVSYSLFQTLKEVVEEAKKIFN
jgi:hypothetical protein